MNEFSLSVKGLLLIALFLFVALLFLRPGISVSQEEESTCADACAGDLVCLNQCTFLGGGSEDTAGASADSTEASGSGDGVAGCTNDLSNCGAACANDCGESDNDCLQGCTTDCKNAYGPCMEAAAANANLN